MDLDTIRYIAAAALALAGALFMLLAALGLLRMPDVFTRLHAASKASTLGVACISLSAALAFADWSVTTRAVVVVVFVFFTVPVAGHLLGRAAYRAGTPMTDRTHVDELGRPSA